MELDTGYIEPLIDDWLQNFHEIIEDQEKVVQAEDEYYIPFRAVPTQIVDTIFKITQYLELGPNAKYIAVHLYDKFMCNYFWEVYKMQRENEQTENSWYRACKQISARSKLYLISCLQLASKMDSHSSNLSISQVLHVLLQIDKNSEYTRNVIFSTEFKVFQTVGFKMPFFTPLNCIEILLVAVDLGKSETMRDVVSNFLDIAYLERKRIYSRLRDLMQDRIRDTHFMALETNILFLAASIILCGAFLLLFESETVRLIGLKLAKLAHIKFNDIWDMANIIFAIALQE